MTTQYLIAGILVGGLFLIYAASYYSRHLRNNLLKTKHSQNRASVSSIQNQERLAQIRQQQRERWGPMRQVQNPRTSTGNHNTSSMTVRQPPRTVVVEYSRDLEMGLPAYEPRQAEVAGETLTTTIGTVDLPNVPPPAYHV